MTKFKIMTTLLLGSSALLLLACTGNTNVNSNQKGADNQDKPITQASSNGDKNIKPYAKPGAAVSFSSNYDEHTSVGETETIQVTINEQYGMGTLTVNINTSAGLALNSTSQAGFSMGDDSDKVIDVSVNAQADGKYYINFQALADTGNGQVMPRTHSIAIYVGDKANYKKTEDTRKIEDTQDGKVIIMDAEETIQ